MTPLYSFRLASVADLPRLSRWLMTPEVVRWWGDPAHEFETLKADLVEPRMTMRVVLFRGRPFAYAQNYEVRAWPKAHFALCSSAKRSPPSIQHRNPVRTSQASGVTLPATSLTGTARCNSRLDCHRDLCLNWSVYIEV